MVLYNYILENFYLILFNFFVFLIIFFSFLMFNVKNPIYSILCLIFTFFISSCILLIFDIDFFAVILIIVYIGAIAVLFLFIIMMLNLKLLEKIKKNSFFKFWIGFSLLIIAFFIINEILKNEFFFNGLLLKKDFLSNKISLLVLFSDNINNIALFLYTEYYCLFLLAGFILLIAMVGSISLTYQSKIKNIQYEKIQNIENYRNIIKLKK